MSKPANVGCSVVFWSFNPSDLNKCFHWINNCDIMKCLLHCDWKVTCRRTELLLERQQWRSSARTSELTGVAPLSLIWKDPKQVKEFTCLKFTQKFRQEHNSEARYNLHVLNKCKKLTGAIPFYIAVQLYESFIFRAYFVQSYFMSN